MRLTDLVFALICGLAGCGSGCDGEHRKPVDSPRPPRPPDDAAPAVAVDGSPAPPPDAPLATTAGFLDAPPGSLDGLFTGLAGIEHGDPSARVLWLFFGDSHTAGDSMTSR